MKTTFRVKEPYAGVFASCAKEYQIQSPARPERFIRKMKENQGSVGVLTGMGTDEEGLERKNPVIAALGDSVTAGHFESLLPADPEVIARMLEAMRDPAAMGEAEKGPRMKVEITDARESYVEKFRLALIDKYETTSVSVINAGIAGDNLLSMAARAYRDVIRYQPDLVLINGSLNWGPELGTTEDYRKILTDLVKRIKAETEADIILLTPNGDLPNGMPFYMALGMKPQEPTTPERVRVIREVAEEQKVCLADVYAVWEDAREKGCPWKELLANGVNHPGAEGHQVYADVLMKLFE